MLDGDDGTNPDDADDRDRAASTWQEPNPEADLADPETELPNVPSPPSVDIPAPTVSVKEVPGELLAGFWTTVLVFNVAVFATSLGLLLLATEGVDRLGAGALVVGLFAALHGYWKYRSLSERHRSGEWRDESAAGQREEREREEPTAGRPAGQERDGSDDERNG